MPRHLRYLMIIIALSLLCSEGRAQEKVDVFAVGSVLPVTTPISPWLSEDPAFEVTLLPTRFYDTEEITADDARRTLRIYFPRNDQAMRDYDCVLFSGGDVRFFEARYIQMIKRAVESGVGAATDMGGMSGPLHPSWIASGIYEIFPNDVLAVSELWNKGISHDKVFSIKVNKQLEYNPLLPFVSVGIERLIGGRTRIILPMEGSTSYGWMECQAYSGYNFASRASASVVWRYGEGKTNAFEAFLGHSWWSRVIDPSDAEYGQDILINYLLDVSDKGYHTDIQMVHQYRQSLSDYHGRYSYIEDLLSFVGRFGANTNPIDRQLESLGEELSLSHELYLEGDVESAIEISRSLISELFEMEEDAKKARSRALMWVYVSEWLVVTATLMISGYVIDQLMIKRKLYKTTAHTRLGSS